VADLEEVLELCEGADGMRVEVAHDGLEGVVRRRSARCRVVELACHLAQASTQRAHVTLQLFRAHLGRCAHVRQVLLQQQNVLELRPRKNLAYWM
jgi:hypothetical protein